MRFILIGIVAALAGCAGNQTPLNYTSPSGSPTITVSDKSQDEVKSSIITECLNEGWQIKDQGSVLICWNEMEVMKAAFAQALIGNSYSTTPTINREMVITKSGNDVTVVGAQVWMETQMAFGQLQKQNIVSNESKNDFYNFLMRVKYQK